VKNNALAFELDDPVVARPTRAVTPVEVGITDDQIIGVGGMALWGDLLDRLGVYDQANRRQLRVIGPAGYNGGECYRSLVEVLLAGGDFLVDRHLLSGNAIADLRGDHSLASHTTLWRFLAGASAGKPQATAAVNRVMLRRAWAMGAGPTGTTLTIDPDATAVETYGPGKEGSRFGYKGKVCMAPFVGVLGETGDVIAVRARGGSANPGRALGNFIRECLAAIPHEVLKGRHVWVRSDSAGHSENVIATAESIDADYSVSAKKTTRIKEAIASLAADNKTKWRKAKHCENAEVGETTVILGEGKDARTLRLIVRRQRRGNFEQLSIDDIDSAYHYFAFVTNVERTRMSAVRVDAHHRLRGGIPEGTIARLKEGFGFIHAPLESFWGNAMWWHAAALAYNVCVWLQKLALPAEFNNAKPKRMRLAFLNIPAKVVNHARGVTLKLPRTYAYFDAFVEALARIRRLPYFA
jgi:hypothetical protein